MWTHDGACGSHGVPHSGAVSALARSPALRPRPHRSLRLHRKDRQRRRGAALRVLVRGMAGFFLIIGIACCAAANELTASDVEYLRTITPSQTPRFLRDMTPAEASCMHELINRPGEENERRTIVSAFVGWIVLCQVTGDRTPPKPATGIIASGMLKQRKQECRKEAAVPLPATVANLKPAAISSG